MIIYVAQGELRPPYSGLRSLRGDRPALYRRVCGRGDLPGRFRCHRRGDPCHGGDGCDLPHGAGCAAGGGMLHRGVPLGRTFGVSAVFPPGRVARQTRSRRAAVRSPRECREVAQKGELRAHDAAQTRPVGKVRRNEAYDQERKESAAGSQSRGGTQGRSKQTR